MPCVLFRNLIIPLLAHGALVWKLFARPLEKQCAVPLWIIMKSQHLKRRAAAQTHVKLKERIKPSSEGQLF